MDRRPGTPLFGGNCGGLFLGASFSGAKLLRLGVLRFPPRGFQPGLWPFNIRGFVNGPKWVFRVPGDLGVMGFT